MDAENWGVQNELEAEGDELQIVWFTCGSLLRSGCSVDVDVLIFWQKDHQWLAMLNTWDLDRFPHGNTWISKKNAWQRAIDRWIVPS